MILKKTSLATLSYCLGLMITYINMWLFPFMLQEEQLGLYNVIIYSATLLSSFAQFGLAQSIIRYFPYFKKNRASFLTFVLTATCISYLVFVIIFCIFQEPIAAFFIKKSAAVIHYFPLILFISFTIVLNIVLKTWLQSLFKIVIPNVIQMVNS